MVGVGSAMLLLAWTGAWFSRSKALPPRWLLWGFAAFTFSGWVATLCGWLVTEMGRQPWLVTGVLRTAEAAGPVSEAALGASLTVYVVTYTAMLLAYMVVITHIAGKGAQAARALTEGMQAADGPGPGSAGASPAGANP
jgi:cytochrome d ubiquinol oxidase subunit I